MYQDKRARLTLWSDLKLIASSRFPSPFIAFFIRNVFVTQILFDKNGGRLNPLLLKLNTKGIVAICQRQKERGPSTCQRIENAQPFRVLPAKCSSKYGHVQQYTRKDLVRFPFIAARLSHLYRHKRRKVWLYRP